MAIASWSASLISYLVSIALFHVLFQKKIINGKEYFYLQRKVNGKVVSKYIPAEHRSVLEEQVKRRKKQAEAFRRVRADQKPLKKVLETVTQ